MSIVLKSRSITALVLVLPILLVNGCGKSTEYSLEVQQGDLEVIEEEIEKKEAAILQLIRAQYDAIIFPPEEKKEIILTYDLQRYVSVNKEYNFLSECFLRDLYYSQDGIFVDCYIPVSGGKSGARSFVLLRLNVNEELAVKVSDSNKHKNSWFGNYYLRYPDYLVVSTIQSIDKTRNYKGETIAKGVLVDFYKVAAQQDE